MPDDKHSVRFIVSAEEFARMDKSIPWGMRSEVIRALLKMAIDLTDRVGTMGLGAIMDGSVALHIKEGVINSHNSSGEGK